MRALERILTGIALVVMPFLGLAASAHQIEHGSAIGAVIYGAISLIVIWELARLSWRWHKESRLHRAR
jgi:hypothetical protein